MTCVRAHKAWFGMRMLAAVLLTGPLSSSTQASDLADTLIGAYSNLESYCDRGHFLPSAIDGRERPRVFERCVLKDGTYRNSIGSLDDVSGLRVTWKDARYFHRYMTDNSNGPWTYFAQRRHGGLGDRASNVPSILLLVLRWHSIHVFDSETLRKDLERFRVRPELSDETLVAYEAPDLYGSSVKRLWISRDTGLIRRSSWSENYRAEITEIRVNEPVAAANLTYEVPTSTLVWHEATGNPGLVTAVSLTTIVILGTMYRRNRSRPPPSSNNESMGEVRSVGHRFIGMPAIATMVASAVVFFFAIRQLHVLPDGEWSGVAYKKFEWPTWGFLRPEIVSPPPIYTDAIVAIVCVLGLGVFADWLHRKVRKSVFISFLATALVLSIGLVAYGRQIVWNGKERVYGAPFDWLYVGYGSDASYLGSAFLANVIVGFLLAGCAIWIVHRCRQKEGRRLFMTTVLIATAAVYNLITLPQGGSYEGWSGIPFTWFWWMDVGGGHTRLSALFADFAVGLVFVACMVIVVERLRRLRRTVLNYASVIFFALSIVFLFWRTSPPNPFDDHVVDFYGTPFIWRMADGSVSLMLLRFIPEVLGNMTLAFVIVAMVMLGGDYLIRRFGPSKRKHQ